MPMAGSIIATPVMAGLAVGIAFIILFAAFGNNIVAISDDDSVMACPEECRYYQIIIMTKAE
jgi:secreted protein with Ig-like and vWFA domain